MNNIRQHGISQLIPLLFTLFFAQSCAVLTQSQIDEVGKFARAADNYGSLPGAVMHAHAEIFLAEKTLTAAGFNNPESVTGKIDKGVNEYQRLLKKSAEADSALSILNTYVAMLNKLSSDNFTEQLEQETINLGAELDNAVDQRNQVADTQIDGFGSAVAAIVRGGGGIYIRYKQARALKKAVTDADPIIGEMEIQITRLMDTYISLAGNDEEDLLLAYQSLLKNKKISDPVDDADKLVGLLKKAKNIVPLAKRSRQAMVIFRAAHKSLFEKLQEAHDLQGTIDEIKSLSEEIKAARRLKKEIEA